MGGGGGGLDQLFTGLLCLDFGGNRARVCGLCVFLGGLFLSSVAFGFVDFDVDVIMPFIGRGGHRWIDGGFGVGLGFVVVGGACCICCFGARGDASEDVVVEGA